MELFKFYIYRMCFYAQIRQQLAVEISIYGDKKTHRKILLIIHNSIAFDLI